MKFKIIILALQSFEIPGMPGGNVGMVNLGDILGKSMGNKKGKKKENDC